MFRHVVLLRFTDTTTARDVRTITEALNALPAHIPELRGYHFGSDAGLVEENAHFAIVADFDSIEDYFVYRDHPEHRRVLAEVIRPHVVERVAAQVQLGDPTPPSAVRQMRLVVTAEDYDDALRFYRDVLRLRERAAFVSSGGRVTILDAGRATLELTDLRHAAFIDDVEVGRRVAGHVRVAFEVDDAATTTSMLAAAGADVVARPTRTPWNSLNARLEAPGGLQLTLFTELVDDPAAT
jgi:lactoylglutathione lyase